MARRWLAGTSAGVLIALGSIAPADAQSVRQTARTPETARAATAMAFDIPAQSLDSALNAFGRATGVQLVYDSEITSGLRSAPVRGTLTPSAALSQMLAPTGLSPRFTGPRTATVQRNTAMQARAQTPTSGSNIALETIVVEGEKIARDYFRTYTSVGVVTGQEVYDYNVSDLKQSFNLLANVRSFPAEGGNNGFVIRGLNSEGVTQPTNSAPIISVVIDGAMQNTEATRRGARGVWDVEQIEVLRGPQSTLQGRNSLGGAVIIKTKDPTYTPEFIVDGQAGERKMHSGAFVASTPLVPDQVALRIAGQTMRETKDIAYSNTAVAQMGEDELDQIRAKLLLTPSAIPGLKALFTVNRTIDNPSQNSVTGPDFFARRFDATVSQFSEFRKTAVNNYIADVTYELSPGWKVQSLTTLADTQTKISTPTGSLFDRRDTRDGEDVAQDLRLSFDRPGSALSGVLGFFAGRFSTDTLSFISTTAFGPQLTIQDASIKGETVSIAAYADLRYRFLERWTLIGGGRVLKDKVERNIVGTSLDFNTFLPVSLNENVDNSNTVVLPKFGLAYDLTVNQTLAGTVTKGYRAGYAELAAGTASINRVDPEYMWAYEMAYRSKWFDDRLQINGNVFYYDYKNQQLAINNPLALGQTITENAGKSHLYGAEIEARVRPFEGLTLFAALGLLKTKFDEATIYTGNEFPEAPSVTASAGGIWKHRSGFFVGADVSYTDGYFSPRDLTNDPLRQIDSFTLVNARVGYETKHGTLMLFAKNLFDKQYLTGIGQGVTEATIGDGRQIGVRGTARF